jgi:hypothetical protein
VEFFLNPDTEPTALEFDEWLLVNLKSEQRDRFAAEIDDCLTATTVVLTKRQRLLLEYSRVAFRGALAGSFSNADLEEFARLIERARDEEDLAVVLQCQLICAKEVRELREPIRALVNTYQGAHEETADESYDRLIQPYLSNQKDLSSEGSLSTAVHVVGRAATALVMQLGLCVFLVRWPAYFSQMITLLWHLGQISRWLDEQAKQPHATQVVIDTARRIKIDLQVFTRLLNTNLDVRD